MTRLTRSVLAPAAIVTCLLVPNAMAQRADVRIEPDRFVAASPDALEQFRVLREGGKLRSIAQIEAALRDPTPQRVTLPAPSADSKRPAAVAAQARQSTLRVGWYYLCNKCDKWHVTLAGGYVVADGGVAVSCHHVVVPKSADMREGYLVAQDDAGKCYAVASILASDARMDSVVFRLDGGEALKPMPLNDQVGPGDAAFLLSDPKGYAGYFSSGIVNRFYWQGPAAGDATKFDDARNLRINVSTDWAPGSSGSAVLDEHGNAIGHVSKIRTEVAPPSNGMPRPTDAPEIMPPTTAPAQPRPSPGAGTQIVLHEGIPARAVRLQIERMNAAATPADAATHATP